MAKLIAEISCVYRVIVDEIEVPDEWVDVENGVVKLEYHNKLEELVKPKADDCLRIGSEFVLLDFIVIS